MNNPTQPSTARAGVLAAFATVYVVWGSTYLAMRVAIETLPPLFMAGCRFLIAGGALFFWLWLRGERLPGRDQWRSAVFAGGLMLAGGNGLVVWSEQTVPSGLTALLVGLTPVWFAALEWLRPGGRRPDTRTVAGILVGFSGVALLAGHGPAGGRMVNPLGVAALMLAGISWAAGSLYARYHSPTQSPWMNAALQMLCGSVLLLGAGCATGESARLNWAAMSARSLSALGYLIVFGSWIGFGAYVWLLKASQPSHVATYAYVNPVIALFLGRLLLDEPLTSRVLWAAAVILAGVVITTLPRTRWEKSFAAEGSEPVG